MFAPPRWIQDLVGHATTFAGDTHDSLTLSVTAVPHATFVRVRALELGDVDSEAFEKKTVQAYRLIADALRRQPACHPVRFWNQIPGIHTSTNKGMDRYMLFNAARFTAFREWFGDEVALDRAIATATGVGHHGQDVIIDALASDKPGLNVQNPRQRPPIRYSKRYGLSPPCFARGTITNGHWSRPRLLIGGTASVRDEESVHPEDLPAQTAETFCNLASLIRASLAASRETAFDFQDPEALASIDNARVYYARENQSQEVRGLVERYLPHLSDVEYVRADLCRAELLIEIEGVARMDTSSVVESGTCRELVTGSALAPR
jgi:chorismate lyase/3-hydroxybenzoate synthase